MCLTPQNDCSFFSRFSKEEQNRVNDVQHQGAILNLEVGPTDRPENFQRQIKKKNIRTNKVHEWIYIKKGSQ
jgi:hypothetical protein